MQPPAPEVFQKLSSENQALAGRLEGLAGNGLSDSLTNPDSDGSLIAPYLLRRVRRLLDERFLTGRLGSSVEVIGEKYFWTYKYDNGSVTASSTSEPLYIPKEGDTITLTEDNWTAFVPIIQRYEGREVRRVVDVPVLARPVARGAVIEERDLTWTQLPADRVRADMLVDVSAMVGQAARRSLREGAAMRAIDLEAPVMIARGETVSLVYQAGPLVLTARARALQDAAEGELARFVNLQSNRTIEAIADAPGRARVAGSAFTH